MSEAIDKKITYFNVRGVKNTDKTLDLAVTYCRENNINKIVVASSTGKTALKLKGKAGGSLEVIAVTYSSGSRFPEKVKKFDENRDELEKRGIRIVRGLHGLSATERGFATRYKTEFMPLNIVADTLRMFSQGMKVCVEISVMAAEAGLISPDEDVIALGGSGEGCDTAVLMKPAYASDMFGIKIREIICMPR
ncbi:MAG: hypothetical protein JXB42_07130 [Deltaproteobacteria bacterium]|nr:hypothetical protein [Deltaproteobacteria bacterium]